MSEYNNQRMVLIVEDQAPMRAVLRDFITLSCPGWRCLEAEDGAGARRLFTQPYPEIVLMDISLPDANGIDLTRRFKELAPESAFVVMSVQAGPQITERALAAGAAIFIPKDRIFTELKPFIARINAGS